MEEISREAMLEVLARNGFMWGLKPFETEKQGKWEEYCGDLNCNKCGATVEFYGIKKGDWNYCPNCGARMK